MPITTDRHWQPEWAGAIASVDTGISGSYKRRTLAELSFIARFNERTVTRSRHPGTYVLGSDRGVAEARPSLVPLSGRRARFTFLPVRSNRLLRVSLRSKSHPRLPRQQRNQIGRLVSTQLDQRVNPSCAFTCVRTAHGPSCSTSEPFLLNVQGPLHRRVRLPGPSLACH